jgi:hypothetical protein
LDAVLIAVLWQVFLSRTVVPLATASTVVLGLSVWLVYTADRLRDTWGPARAAESPRHAFARQYRVALLAAIGMLLMADLAIAWWWLPGRELLAGLAMLPLVAVRVFAVRRYPAVKNFFTGLLFAAGIWMPILLVDPWRPGFGLFVLLCTWNCAAIDAWEHATARPLAPAAAVLMVMAFGVFSVTHLGVALAETLSAALCLTLALLAPRLSANHRRIAVDVCLLTPLLLHAG